MMYLTVDGGGSKTIAVLYDEQLNVRRIARSGGVNYTQNSPESASEHIRECLDALAPYDYEIEKAYLIFSARHDLFRQELTSRVKVGSFEIIPEPVAGLLAGGCTPSGLLALAGTGSDVFLIKKRKVLCAVGGWGPFMGDQGSGAWIGLQALRSLGRDVNGWGPKTALTPLLNEHLVRLTGAKRALEAVLASKTPYSLAAGLVPLVAKAAKEGDRVAQEIFEKAGECMGKQLVALIKKAPEHEEREITLCGGAWKASQRMFDACQNYLDRFANGYVLRRPCFEPVSAGAVLMLAQAGFSQKELKHILAERFGELIINEAEVFA